eukprot:TRINITY_DN1903_c0_g1_i2.p1 TRINITY_DN1903_c0_g1~~TRINITY_DN1903_c0_g1_i2.p1  ORF type:complete len:668 (+),score=151.99 TRINITY_DN1903_c0_g1_i2:92-2095(+)
MQSDRSVVLFHFFFFNDTATTEIYTLHIVGSVRCVQETGKDTVNKWLNAEIISQISDMIKVHYTGWSNKYDEWIKLPSDRVLKQWKKGLPIQINNRIDVKHKIGVWLEALVTQINNNNMIYVHYVGYLPKYDEWQDLNSDLVAEVGSFSTAYGNARIQRIKNHLSEKQQEFIKKIQAREQGFQQAIKNKGFNIIAVGMDGNCLFRAVSDQIYGDEQFHKNIRRVCVDYIEQQKEFFEKYTFGGPNKFLSYVTHKRNDGAWGEDVEIQALSEIYDRPIDVYAYSDIPLRRFNESKRNQLIPISLSYHGQSHFNSLRQIIDQDFQKKWGQLETLAFNKIRQIKQLQDQLKDPQMSNSEQIKIELQQLVDYQTLQRKEFESTGSRDLEQAIEESMNLFEQDNIKKAMQNSLTQLQQNEFQEEEKQLLDQAIKESKNIVQQQEQIQLQKIIEVSKLSYEQEQQIQIFEEEKKSKDQSQLKQQPQQQCQVQQQQFQSQHPQQQQQQQQQLLQTQQIIKPQQLQQLQQQEQLPQQQTQQQSQQQQQQQIQLKQDEKTNNSIQDQQQNQQQMDEQLKKVIEDSKLQFKLSEEEQIKQALEVSKQQHQLKDDEILKQVIEQSKKDSMDPMNNQTIEIVVQAGFTLEQALNGYSVYGDQPEAIINNLLLESQNQFF